MQIRLIVPPEEEERERRSKGTSGEPAFCPFVAHGRMLRRGLVLGILLRSNFLVHVLRLMNATDNGARHVF